MFKRANYYFLIPIIGGIPWGGMLIAMLAAWSIQGHPIYWFIHRYQMPVYISHIGATNLQPLFISCASWQGLFYVITLITEYILRRRGLLQYWFKKDERNLLFASTILGGIGQVGLILCSIFDTKDHKTVHSSLLALFVLCVFLSMVCQCTEYLLMGLHYRNIHVSHKYWNKFTVSFYLKLIWTILAAIFAILFEALDDRSKSSIFEWTLAFWYLVLWAIFAWDLSHASKLEHKNYPYVKNLDQYNYYLYEKHFGNGRNADKDSALVSTDHDRDETLAQGSADSLRQGAPPNREFTDDELRQYPLSNEEVYPIPHGQEVPRYERT